MGIARPVLHIYRQRRFDERTACNFSDTDCQNLLLDLISNDPNKLRLMIVIDALDECENNCYELLSSLKSLIRSRPQSVRLLLSSQLHIQDADLTNNGPIVSIQLQLVQTKKDMQAFIKKDMEKQLGKQRGLGGILEQDRQLYDKVGKALLHRAAGMSVSNNYFYPWFHQLMFDYIQVSVGKIADQNIFSNATARDHSEGKSRNATICFLYLELEAPAALSAVCLHLNVGTAFPHLRCSYHAHPFTAIVKFCPIRHGFLADRGLGNGSTG